MISFFKILNRFLTKFKMTITYTAQVATCKNFGCFWKLLFRWKGSIYKLLWPNMILYFTLYMALSFIYRFILDEKQRIIFEKLALHCHTYSDLIPVSFVLGFYVAIVVARWWNQYLSIPWPDSLAMFVSCFVISQDDRGRLIRRTIMRYANLSFLMTLSMISPSVKKRFPTLDHMVKAGFMKEEEKKIFEMMDVKTSHPKYWMPLVWAGSIVTRARKEGRVKDDFAMKTLVDEISKFRAKCGELLNYDWISVPLVYTQVVTLAVYTYFVASLMGNQYLDPAKNYPNHTIDPVVPIFTLLQFFFYMGWLMVAETLVNPFGEDDDDFEINWLIDRNLQVSYVVVDEMHQDHPELLKDQHWDDVFPSELPYTEATKQFQTQPFMGSTHNVEVPEGKSNFVPLDTLPENRNTNSENVKESSAYCRSVQEKGNFKKQMKPPFNSMEISSDTTTHVTHTTNGSMNNKKYKFTADNSVLSVYRKNLFIEDSLNSIETGVEHGKLPYYSTNDEINVYHNYAEEAHFRSKSERRPEKKFESINSCGIKMCDLNINSYLSTTSTSVKQIFQNKHIAAVKSVDDIYAINNKHNESRNIEHSYTINN